MYTKYDSLALQLPRAEQELSLLREQLGEAAQIEAKMRQVEKEGKMSALRLSTTQAKCTDLETKLHSERQDRRALEDLTLILTLTSRYPFSYQTLQGTMLTNLNLVLNLVLNLNLNLNLNINLNLALNLTLTLSLIPTLTLKLNLNLIGGGPP